MMNADDRFLRVPMSSIAVSTSAYFLFRYIQALPVAEGEERSQRELRAALAADLYIKARGFAILNKVSFLLSIPLAIAVIFWPAIAAYTQTEVLATAAAQTSLTAAAAFFIFAYRHYKGRQLAVENLLRVLAFKPGPVSGILDEVIAEMSRIDRGFTFHGIEMRIQPETEKPQRPVDAAEAREAEVVASNGKAERKGKKRKGV